MTENEKKLRNELALSRRLMKALETTMIAEIGKERYNELMMKAVRDAVFGEMVDAGISEEEAAECCDFAEASMKEEAGHERT